MNKFQGALTHLVFERERELFSIRPLASGIDDTGTGLMAARFGAGKQESDLLENLGKKYQQNPDVSCQKGKGSQWKHAVNFAFCYIPVLLFSTVGSLKGTVLHIDSNQGPGPTDIVGELLWPQIVLPEDGTGCGHIAI